MVSFSYLVALSFVLPALAAPVEPLVLPHIDPKKILCQLPILKKILCPRSGNNGLSRVTPLGVAQGVADPDGGHRFSVKYASAQRWRPSVAVTTWSLPNGSNNASALPLACPQPDVDSSTYSEDCLSIVLYVPPNLTPTSNVPALVWFHGGSFVVGSATGPGLDGSKLAIATNSIVAVMQYRLGALGFMGPTGQTNFAIKDAMVGLNFLKTVLPSFGGSASKITLAGQSSGANVARALLATPSASSLFRSAILQSDPMNFGFLKPSTQTTLQQSFNSQIGCTPTDTACLDALPLSTIINAQMDVYSNGWELDPAAGRAQPIRPVLDGTLITAPLDSTGSFPSQSKPILITSTSHEAGSMIYGTFPAPLPEFAFPPVCEATFGPQRTEVVVASSNYQPVPGVDGSVDARVLLQTVGTDYLWRCSSWTFARSWVQHGGSAYVGQYVVGTSYPGNEAVSYCTQPGVICHQDDIQIVFGTTSNPTPAQAALTIRMQKHYKAFLSSGNPNASGVTNWPAATTSDVHSVLLGGSGETTVGACDPAFWGSGVQYDYQYYQ